MEVVIMLNDKKIYYVYSYSTPDGEIFYIGKGKGNRLYYHLYEAKKEKLKGGRRNYAKIKKIRDILANNQEPIIKKVSQNINEYEALNLEKQLIRKFGRFDIGTGTLLNMTDGGEGISGNICSQERKLKISLANKGRKFNEETKQHFRVPKSEQGKINISLSKNKPVKQLNKQGELIKIWPSAEIAVNELQKLGYKVHQRNISACCRSIRKTSGGFKWQFI
jgi:hypothetical protein